MKPEEYETHAERFRQMGLVPVVVPRDLFEEMTENLFTDFWDDRFCGAMHSKETRDLGINWDGVAESLNVESVRQWNPGDAPGHLGTGWHQHLSRDPEWTPTLWCRPHPSEDYPQ